MLSKKAKRREEARQQGLRQTTSADTAQSDQSHVADHAKHPSGRAERIRTFFDQHYKQLMLIPTLLLLLAIGQIGYQISTTGDFVAKSVSLKGGVMVTVLQQIDAQTLGRTLGAQFPDGGVQVDPITGGGVSITAAFTYPQEVEQLVAAVREQGSLAEGEYTVEIVGATLGESFFRQTMIALLIAFCFISIVVFVSFRSIAPSLFVILAAGSDIITTLAIFNVVGYELTTAGIAAFLMLIGYSIDTDVLLTSRVLRRREGTITNATIGAIGTGLTMSFTTIGATLVGLLLTKSDVLQQIMFIICVGVAVDMIYTWLYNAPILKWYLERKVGHG